MKESLLLILFDPDTYVWAMFALMTILTCLVYYFARKLSRRWMKWVLTGFFALMWFILIDGSFMAVRRLDVRHVEFASEDLPASFDGYRIVQFSDAHVASYTGWREPLLRRAVDSINAQAADLIVFTGDLQNKLPDEILPHREVLSSLHAKDGVISVLGNHDYPMYIDADPFQKDALLGKTCSLEEELGWRLLCNQHYRLHRGGDSIIIAGMENDGEGRFPELGDINRTLHGLNQHTFVVMLEHDPTAWRRKILTHSHSQLTLSGHTHGGQFEFLGLTPAALRYDEYGGMYYMGSRAMNVSTGLSGVLPIRFGVTPEIVVVTLKRLKK